MHLGMTVPNPETILMSTKKENQIYPPNSLFGWFSFFTMMLVSQGWLLWLDHHPMFFLGDSGSYIWSAVSGNPPTDRSFLYGYFIRLVAVSAQTLTTIVIVQTFLTCVVSGVMAHLLIRYFQVRTWIAFAFAFLTAIEPLQLLYARYIMTESLALTMFVFYVWAALHYLENPQIRWFIVIQCLATLMIAIRFAFIPLVWICAFAIPLLTIPTITNGFKTEDPNPLLQAIGHLAVSVFVLFAFTSAYKQYHGYLQHKPPAYSYDGGFFALAYIIPIVDLNDFPDEDIGKKILCSVKFSTKDRRVRGSHRWEKGGVVDLLQKIEPNRIRADAIARSTVIRAISRKPLAFLKLGGQTLMDYLNPSYLQSSMENDMGVAALDDGLYDLIKKHFRYPGDQSSAFDLNTPTGRYFLSSGNWLQFLLFMPLWWCLLILFAHDVEERRKSLLIGLISFICIGVVLFLVERPTPRYLHPCSWFFFLAAGIGLNRMMDITQRKN
ncbi:MAG: hypothetical protein MUE70_00145 [Desulfobacterales bacterium]|nr:hypothetical protein [Desulfobacterales bacterium]